MNIQDAPKGAVIDPARLWKERVEFFASGQWTHALHLSYNDWPVRRDRIRRDLRALHARVDRALFGTRFHKKSAAERTRFVAFVEGEDRHHPHVHSVWWVPRQHLLRFAGLFCDGLWSKFAYRGSHEMTLIHPDRGCWSYSTKRFTAEHEWIWSDEFLPSS